MTDSALARFERLPELERRMLTALALIQERLSRSRIVEWFRELEIRPASGPRYTTKDLIPLLTNWAELGLAEHAADGSTYWAAPRFARDLLERLRATGELAAFVSTVRAIAPPRRPYSSSIAFDAACREVVFATMLGWEPEIERLFECWFRDSRQPEGELYFQALGVCASRAQLERLGFSRAEAYLQHAFSHATARLIPVDDELIAFLDAASGLIDSQVLALGAYYLALRGEHARASALLAQRDDAETSSAQSFLALARGEYGLARAHAERAIEQTRTKKSGKLKGLAPGPLWGWVVLALATDPQRGVGFGLAREQLDLSVKRDPGRTLSLMVLRGVQHFSVTGEFSDRNERQWPRYAVDWTELALYATALRFAGVEEPASLVAALDPWQERAREAQFEWLAGELTRLRDRAQPSVLASLHAEEAPWERSLRVLEGAIESAEHQQEPQVMPNGASDRLVWLLVVNADGSHQVSVRVQTRTASGYSGGRQIGWKKLYELSAQADWISDDDRRVLRMIERVHDSYSRAENFVLSDRAAAALVGHPLCFEDYDCRVRTEVVRGEVRIELEEREGELAMVVAPCACTASPVVCERPRPGRTVVYALSKQQEGIVSAVSPRGLRLPVAARERVAPLLRRLVPHFAVATELAFDRDELPTVDADARIHVQLGRGDSGLRVRLAVIPLGDERTLEPGRGARVVLGRRSFDGVLTTVRANRDLDEERRQLRALFAACPTLGGESDVFEYQLTELAACLELLSELRAMGDAVALTWREGAPYKLTSDRGARHLRLSVCDQGHWFDTEGELEVDESLKLSFHALLTLKRRHAGRFLPLDDGRYLALTRELARMLDRAAALAREHSGECVSLHPLALLSECSVSELRLDADRAVTERVKRAREARTLEPAPPEILSSLRPYQHEGYVWLKRLAHWGAGACLADDMGLGKTVQALALVRSYAAEGPSLVVAPTSVCGNWLEEVARHAPDLRAKRLGNGDRARVLAELESFDLLICSYGVLQQERELLAKKQFRVVVLDEAQAIKNPATLRAKAVGELRADVRVALTGTPIENHLGELWSLFNFLNPGLLGTARAFEERFGRPIQGDGDRAAADLLKRIVQPFILRRRKSEVLAELPPKTLITLHIEPSEEERALYAALREQAIARASLHDNAAQARIHLLAELTRLRRAACHPRLVAPEAQLESSKLRAFEELLTELREGGHRTLVFSQFVDHLALVRERLEALHVPYQYLDGSTPPEARSRAVRAFQSGQGDVFLISLKAGGFGLNLTAADYVVHLDPWWNPAVEDQASDRAHRIGQERPVTIYRLVMQDSIEEKMLSLHADKRDLADVVLDGSGLARGPDLEELLELLEEVQHDTESRGTRRTSAASQVVEPSLGNE